MILRRSPSMRLPRKSRRRRSMRHGRAIGKMMAAITNRFVARDGGVHEVLAKTSETMDAGMGRVPAEVLRGTRERHEAEDVPCDFLVAGGNSSRTADPSFQLKCSSVRLPCNPTLQVIFQTRRHRVATECKRSLFCAKAQRGVSNVAGGLEIWRYVVFDQSTPCLRSLGSWVRTAVGRLIDGSGIPIRYTYLATADLATLSAAATGAFEQPIEGPRRHSDPRERTCQSLSYRSPKLTTEPNHGFVPQRTKRRRHSGSPPDYAARHEHEEVQNETSHAAFTIDLNISTIFRQQPKAITCSTGYPTCLQASRQPQSPRDSRRQHLPPLILPLLENRENTETDD
ncbi:hypothetical protein B0T19DRAFT_467346 [Cercophora scortea]|uniref:Uncharacterized protein n=1 Tax=Cercophora scortea TaxID=314031 RepID=A0AAE0M570_9PEZI|nr:hypothetical protein B0T19DRAFT_467346 [Cercophora scortea]